MIQIKELDNKGQIREIALLHIKAFPSFFLTQLGYSFLKTLYKGYLEDELSGIIIAEDNGQLLGFLAYSKDYSSFFKKLVKHHLFEFALYSVKTAVLNPSTIKRILLAFNKSEDVKREEQYVELASICVDPSCESKGIGTALITYLKSIIDFDEYEYITLETDAESNDRANSFYLNNGFTLNRSYTVNNSRKMNEYRYYQEK